MEGKESVVFEIEVAGKILANAFGQGDGGSIEVGGHELKVYGRILSESIGVGKGGEIYLVPSDLLEIGGDKGNSSNNRAEISSVTNGAGKGGSIRIESDRLEYNAYGLVRADANSTGDGGVIDIRVRELIGDGAGQIIWWGGEQQRTYTAIRAAARYIGTEELGGKGGSIKIDAESIELKAGAWISVDTHGTGDAGLVKITTGDLVMSGNNTLISSRVVFDTSQSDGQILWKHDELTGTGGSIDIEAENIEINKAAQIVVETIDGVGDGGEIVIDSGRLAISGGGEINGSTNSKGDAGKVQLKVNNLTLNNGRISSEAKSVGAAGSIIIEGKGEESKILLSKGSVSTSTNKGSEVAGNIDIEADQVVLGRVEISSNSKSEGNSGGIRLKGNDRVEVGHNAKVSSVTESSGDGGSVRLEGGLIDVVGGVVTTDSTSVEENGGNAGSIVVWAKELNLQDGGRMSSVSLGRGDAGSVDVAVETFKIAGTGSETGRSVLSSSTYYGGEIGEGGKGGEGGSIRIKGDKVEVGKYGEVLVETLGSGDGGELKVEAGEFVVSGKGARVSGQSGYRHGSDEWESHERASGKGGSLNIEADRLTISQDGLIQSSSTGLGNGGRVAVDTGWLDIRTGASISTEARKSNGGEVELKLSEGLMMSGGTITTKAKKDGGSVIIQTVGDIWLTGSEVSAEAGQDGGNIEIRSPQTLVLQRSRLSANAILGHGGYILITADGFLPSIETSITASSEFGVQGMVEIRTPDTDVGSGLVVPPETLVSKNINLAERCALRLAGDVSSFFLNGQGGIPVWASHSYLPTLIIPEPDDAYRPSDRSDEQ